ncbi:MAG: hypothetical protein V1793_10635 [Pseudomonadota bacterium]
MKFNVPYIPHAGYTDFLAGIAGHLDTVHFSLHTGPPLDSRMRFNQVDTRQLAEGLARIRGPLKYCLLNTRFIRPDLYDDPKFFTRLLASLEILKSCHCLDGIVFCDFYFLARLSREGGSFMSDIQAIPGVNAMLDSSDKVMACLDIIDTTHFRPPGKLCLDRSLNRNIPALEQTGRQLRNHFPGIRLELLANEGCLYQCPFKPAHDVHIALSNTGLVREKTFEINRDAGCMPVLFNHPDKIFKSPFIRPEDVRCYEGLADVLKLCGRTLGPGFMEKTISAYIRGDWSGNLLEILDAMEWMSGSFHVDNPLLGKDFLKTLTNCSKDCRVCSICSSLMNLTTKRKQPVLSRYKDEACKF